MAQAISLQDSVQFLRGVGPARANEFASLGIRTIGDLIEHFPFRHEHRPKSQPIGTLSELGAPATLIGELRRVRERKLPDKHVIHAEILDATGRCFLRWFNSPYLADRLGNGVIVRVTGRLEAVRDCAGMTNPQTQILAPDADPFSQDEEQYEPVYPATGKLSSQDIRRALRPILHAAADQVEEILPEGLRTLRRLPPRRTAILRIHEPTSADDAEHARRRLAYDEFLVMQLAMRMRRRSRGRRKDAPVITTTPRIDERIRARLPFALTAGQEEAVRAIRSDLASPQPMNRLLQGDVGCGKTVVALYAALSTVANGAQAAILVPTEILARQHFEKTSAFLAGSQVRIVLLTGELSASARRDALGRIRRGEADLVIGTHALIEGDVRFRRLALVVIDEQHRFGVAQRHALRGKGPAPHTLVMTATPIPRSLAMTVFGDLDVTVIPDRPPGRRAVATSLVPPSQQDRAWRDVRERLSAGEQAFIVYPLVEESESLPLKAATQELERLSAGPLSGLALGVVHGRMRSDEKDRVMTDFRDGRIRALLATTVIEVGVDVPEATLMIVEHAERFGISQLHQLRGRVGRGDRPATCLLMTGSDAPSETALTRLRVLCETDDGFRIAEEDLRLRGPGELLGTRQHGLPAFKAADVARDLDLLQSSRDDAASVLEADPGLGHPEHDALRRCVLAKYADALAYVDVG